VSTSHLLLGLLSVGPQHGYDLKRAHDERLPQARPLAFGQVYATLGRLERDGLVEQAGQDRDGGPDRTTYAITDAGRAKLDEWLAAIEPPAPYVNSVLFAKVVVSLLASGVTAATDYLVAQRAAHTTRMRELTTVKTTRDSTAGDVVAADYAIAHLDADLRWLQATLLRIAELHREVTT
jgi:DNA-binding PadR family transcriptional regulator